jgi:hypothetical protein
MPISFKAGNQEDPDHWIATIGGFNPEKYGFFRTMLHNHAIFRDAKPTSF